MDSDVRQRQAEHQPDGRAVPLDVPVEVPSSRRIAVSRFAAHRPAVVSAVVLCALAVIAALAPFTARYGVNEAVFKTTSSSSNTFLPPSSIAWLGTDEIGRDLYSRLIYATRMSLIIGCVSATMATTVGVLIGGWAGFRGGKVDDILMRTTDLFLAFPFLVTLLLTRALLGQLGFLEWLVGPVSSVRFVVVLFAAFGWMSVARITRGEVLALREREFVEASRALGAGGVRIFFTHLLPNAWGPILVSLSSAVAAAIVAEATLGFFGFGPQSGSGQTSLGNLVGQAKGSLLSGEWWLVVFPCAALVIVSLCVNFVADGLRAATDPRADQARST